MAVAVPPVKVEAEGAGSIEAACCGWGDLQEGVAAGVGLSILALGIIGGALGAGGRPDG